MTIRTALALGDIFVGLLFIAVSVPLMLNRIPPNGLYGFRIPKAFRSEDNWYCINEYGGKALALWSLPLLLLGVVKFFVPFEDMYAPWGWIWLIGPLVTCTLGAIIQTLIYAWKL